MGKQQKSERGTSVRRTKWVGQERACSESDALLCHSPVLVLRESVFSENSLLAISSCRSCQAGLYVFFLSHPSCSVVFCCSLHFLSLSLSLSLLPDLLSSGPFNFQRRCTWRPFTRPVLGILHGMAQGTGRTGGSAHRRIVAHLCHCLLMPLD